MYYVSTSYFYSFDGSDLKTKLFANKEAQTKYFEQIKGSQLKYFAEIINERFGMKFEGQNITSNEYFDILVNETEDFYCITFVDDSDEKQTIEEVYIAIGEEEVIL